MTRLAWIRLIRATRTLNSTIPIACPASTAGSESFRPDFVLKLAATLVNLAFFWNNIYFLFQITNHLQQQKNKAGTGEQIVIRTCTVSKLLDSDSSHSSFTLRSPNGSDLKIVSGLIASCKDDGCNNSNKIFDSFNLFLKCFILISITHTFLR